MIEKLCWPSTDTFRAHGCHFSHCEPLWALCSWFCELCSYGVLHRSSPSSEGFHWLHLVFGCGLCICSYQLLESASQMTIGISTDTMHNLVFLLGPLTAGVGVSLTRLLESLFLLLGHLIQPWYESLFLVFFFFFCNLLCHAQLISLGSLSFLFYFSGKWRRRNR